MTTSRYLGAWVLQAIGAATFIALVIFYFLTGNQSALLTGASLSLMGIGGIQALKVRVQIEREKPPEPDEKRADTQ